ncbi:hypothetical protein NKI48_29605 [Mesorhizobium sp. M0644]|uniref:hypothetical protein n=1 Tax=Mesorhizobium sp. M0644 TaxID=2956979 RepID=UPI00333BA734
MTDLKKGAEVRALSPADANFGTDLSGAIRNADLILLDHNLHLDQGLGLTASDGASFVGHLRSWARANEVSLPPLVIYTSEDSAFSDETPALGPAVPLNGSFVGQEARIAPALDVEWLISKNLNGAVPSAIGLAEDSRRLRQNAGDGRMSLEETAAYLTLPKDPAWSDIAFASIARWRPPISEPGTARAGARGTTAILRWLLHQVLPCPGLLVSNRYAAWSLGIELDGFKGAAKGGGNDFAKMLGAARYAGPGHALYSPRWWAAGIDFIGWQLRDQSYEKGGIQQAFDSMAGVGLHPLAPPEKVVVVNSDLEEEGLAAIDEAVEIYPPGWPAEALKLWMRRDEAANDAAAKSMIDPSELATLS